MKVRVSPARLLWDVSVVLTAIALGSWADEMEDMPLACESPSLRRVLTTNANAAPLRSRRWVLARCPSTSIPLSVDVSLTIIDSRTGYGAQRSFGSAGGFGSAGFNGGC